MIYFDVTHAHRCRHHSGLLRVSARLLAELGPLATPVKWRKGHWVPASGQAVGRKRLTGFKDIFGNRKPVVFSSEDWLFTPEVFSPVERPGFTEFLARREVAVAGLFHDAIPLKFPEITWPQSVCRHAHYMNMMAEYDRVLAVSNYSAEELRSFWRWQGKERTPVIIPIDLGANFYGHNRPAVLPRIARAPRILCTGIIEPRKNQGFLMEVCESLWNEGLVFELHFVGRVNPHFGAPLMAQMRRLQKKGRVVIHHARLRDDELTELYARARFTAFPTLAEGCGLPVRESIWMGTPCVCSDLPVLKESAEAGGCRLVSPNDQNAWRECLRALLTDDARWEELATLKLNIPHITWQESARQLAGILKRPRVQSAGS